MLTCMRKIQYKNRRKAEAALEKMMVSLPAKDIRNLHSYKCPHCHQWHLGNSHGKRSNTDH